jgi:hypothetical protein
LPIWVMSFVYNAAYMKKTRVWYLRYCGKWLLALTWTWK